jgi:hypothetical protein
MNWRNFFLSLLYSNANIKERGKQMALTRSAKTMVSTVECYDAWSNTYDSDGNVLQLLDDVAFDEICQPLLNSTYQNNTTPICCELGCGTGRNTKKILQAKWSVVSIIINYIYLRRQSLNERKDLIKRKTFV